MSSILQRIQKKEKNLLKLRQEDIDMEHKSFMKQIVIAHTATFETVPRNKNSLSPSMQHKWSEHPETQNVLHQDQQHALQKYQQSQRQW